MRNQYQGPPRPTQQQGLNDRQVWEQQMMFKQFQEMQRQRQLQQLDLGGRQQNSHAQLSDIARQAGNRQPLPVLSGMPINNASNYSWPGEFTGDAKATNSPHMFLGGNMSQHNQPAMHGISSGPMFSHNQSQTMRPMGFVQQHGDQSLYGTPVSSTRYANHHPQSQGMSHGFTELPNKSSDPLEKGSMQPSVINHFQNNQSLVTEHSYGKEGASVANQGFQGKILFGNTPVPDPNSGDVLGNFQQADQFAGNSHVQEFQGMHKRDNWSGKLQENIVSHAGTSRGMANLDPTEEKILFGSDNDNNWGGSLGINTNSEMGYSHVSNIPSNDHLSAFPSMQGGSAIQSGSWSALMLDALDASSSDTGVQEEWSGFSVQKTEPSTSNQYAFLNDNGKQKMSCDEKTPQIASSLTLRSHPSFNDADANPSHQMFPSFQQSSKFAYQQNETVQPDVSNDSSQQSSKEATKPLDQDHRKKQFVVASPHEQTSFDNASNGNWPGHMYGQSVSTRNSADMEFSMQNRQLAWDHQQKMPMQSASNMSNDKSNGRNINHSPGGDNTPNTPDSRIERHGQPPELKNTMHTERDHEGNVWRVRGNQVATFPEPSSRQEVRSDAGSPTMRSRENHIIGNYVAATDSGAFEMNQQVQLQAYQQNVAMYQNHIRRNQQVRDSSMYTTQRNEMGEMFNQARQSNIPTDTPNESYISNHSHPSQQTDSDGGSRENSLLDGNDSGPLVSSRQKSSGQSGRKTGARKFQYHPMGNLEMDPENAGSHVNRLYSHGANNSLVRGSKNQEPGHIGRSEFASQNVPAGFADMRKEQLTDLQRSTKAADEAQPSGTYLSHDSPSSFDGSTTSVSQNKPSGHTSHNMLELLHKVDQSRNNNTVGHFSLADHNRLSEIPNNTSDGSVHLQHDHSSILQGYGLKLAPPSQWQPTSGHDLASQISLKNANEIGTRDLDLGRASIDRACSPSNPSVPSPPLASQVTKFENFDSRSNMYGQMNKQTSHLGNRGNSLAYTTRTLPYGDRSTVQQQRVSSVSGSPMTNQSPNHSMGSQVNTDSQVKPFFHPRQAQGSNERNLSVHPAQGSLRTVPSPAPPPRFNPSSDTCRPTAVQFHSPNSGPSEPPDSGSHPRSSGRQFPIGETRSTAQPSANAGMPQQGVFSSMLNNVLSGISTQHIPMDQVQKIIPRMPHSMGPLTNNTAPNLWNHKKAEAQADKEVINPPEFGTFSKKSMLAEEYPVIGQSSQGMPLKKMGAARNTTDASRGQEQVSPMVHLQHQEIIRRNHANESSFNSHEHVSVPNADAQNQNYSPMKQVQSMRESESDPSKRAGKRLRGPNFGADAPQIEGTASQKFVHGQNKVYRESDAATQKSSFPSDVKMLSFSRESEDESANTPSQVIRREKLPEDLINSIQKNFQNHSHSVSEIAKLNLMRGDKRSQINSQMSSSWFDLYRPCKTDQVIASCDGADNSEASTQVSERLDNIMEQRSDATQGGAISQTYAPVSERIGTCVAMEQEIDATQDAALLQSAFSSALATNENMPSFSLPSIANDMVMIPKKRKTRTSELLPWHKEVAQGSRRLLSISIAERDWAKAANRLIEKVEDGFEMVGVGSSMTPARRRLIVTTQLMQLLFPSAPHTFLRADATTSYESMTYSVGKLTLGDATSVISCSSNDSLQYSNHGELKSDKFNSSEETRDHLFIKNMESYIGTARQLESHLSRTEKTPSILDVRMECHDLDRCSIVNRLAKFHGRAQKDGAAGSSISESAPCRIFPQRQVTAQSINSNLPIDVKCVLL